MNPAAADNVVSKPPLVICRTSQPFWEAVKARRLLLQYDSSAKRYQFFPRPISLHSTTPLEWRLARGSGVLVAFTLTHFPAPGFKDELPYFEGLIRLDEGPRIFAPLMKPSGAPFEIGQRMQVVWPERDDEPLIRFMRA